MSKIKTICLDDFGGTFVSYKNRDYRTLYNTIYEEVIIFQPEVEENNVLYPATSLKLYNIDTIKKLRDFLNECINDFNKQEEERKEVSNIKEV